MDKINELTLKKIYDELELELIASLHRNLMRHLKEEEQLGFTWEMWQHTKLRSLQEFRRRNESLVGAAQPYAAKAIQQHINNVYKLREQQVLEKLPQQIIKSPPITNPLVPNSKIADLGTVPPQETNFFQVNDTKVQTLIEEVTDSTKKANSLVVRRMNDIYSETMLKSQLAMSNGTLSLKQAIQLAVKDLGEKGIDAIVYKNGRKVNISTYAEMILRTATQRAKFLADGKVRSSLKRYLVVSSIHHNCCDHCLEWQGRVLIDDVFSDYSQDKLDPIDLEYVLKHNPPKLSTAVKDGFLHPNCRHALATFFPEVNKVPSPLTDEEKEEAKKRYDLEMKKRVLENNIRKLRRQKTLAVDKKTKQEATAKWKKAIAERKALDNVIEMVAKPTSKVYNKGRNSELKTIEDPVRELMGSMFDSHPKETEKIINNLVSKGIEVEIVDYEKMVYMPATRRPGKLSISKNASYSALLHETQHALDDIQSNFTMYKTIGDKNRFIELENKAYNVEIEFCKTNNVDAKIIERLENLKLQREEEIRKWG